MAPATKADIERRIEGKELPFYTVTDAVTFGKNMVSAMKEAAELKQQTQYMGQVGMMNLSQLGTLDLTEMRDAIYGVAESNDGSGTSADTMPQITEDSRDVSPSQSHTKDQEMEQPSVSDGDAVKPKKKETKEMDVKQRDNQQKSRSDVENKDLSKGRDIKGEEKPREEVPVKENQIQKAPDTKERPSKLKQVIKTKSQQGLTGNPQTKGGQAKQLQKNQKSHVTAKEQQHVHSRTTNVIHKDSDPKIGTEIRQTRETIMQTKSQERSSSAQPSDKAMTGMAARLNEAKASARASNMMQSIANITQATSRTITVRNGNDIFMTAKEGDQTFAYVNGQKVGAQDATKFFEKMNAEQGPAKTMQMETMIKQAALNPAFQTQNIASGLEKAQEAKEAKHAEKSGKDRGDR